MGSLLATMSRAAYGSVTASITGVFTRVTSFFTGLLGTLFSRIGHALAELPGMVLRGIGTLAEGVRSALGVVAGALKYGLYGIVGVVGGAVALLGKSVQAASTWSKSVSAFSASTGLSSRTAGAVQSRFGAFGLDASEMMGGQNPGMFGLHASVYGVPGYTDPNFLASAAGRFQGLNRGGVMGNIMAQNMAKSLGMGDSASLRLLNTPVGQIREQQRFSASVRGSMGLDDTAIVNVSRQWDLLTNKMRVFGQDVLLKIAQVALPKINAGFAALLKFGESQAGGIGGLITRAVNTAFAAFGHLAIFLSRTAPSAVLGFTAIVLRGLIAISDFAPKAFRGLLKAVDIGQAGFEWLAKTGERAFDLLSRGISAVSAGISEFIKQLPNLGSMLSGVWDAIRDGVNKLIPGLIPGSSGGGGGGSTLLGKALGVASAATAPAGALAQAAAAAAGGTDPLTQGAAGLYGRYLGGGALMAAGRAALATPLGRVAAGGIALGTGLGYGAYKIGQATGLIDPNQSFLNRMSLGASRISDFVHGTWGQTDNVANMEAAKDRATAHGRATGHPMPHDALGQVMQATKNAWNAKDVPNPLSNLSSMMSGLLDKVPQGSWSQGLNKRFGAGVDSASNSASEALRRALAMIEKEQKGLSSNGVEDLLKQLLSGQDTQTQVLKGQPDTKQSSEDFDRLARIVGQAMVGQARGEYTRLFQR